MLALLLAATAPQTAIDAERAFAAAAQTEGQWTAFRAFAADDATIFLPQPANAKAAMKDWRDPPKAIAWSPTASYVSCDGKVAANTGEWRRPDGSVGYFSTIWVRQPDGGWKWVVDGGDALTTARVPVKEPTVSRAACTSLAPALTQAPVGSVAAGKGHSPDWTLLWEYQVRRDGARSFEVSLYEGGRYRTVILDQIAAPKP